MHLRTCKLGVNLSLCPILGLIIHFKKRKKERKAKLPRTEVAIIQPHWGISHEVMPHYTMPLTVRQELFGFTLFLLPVIQGSQVFLLGESEGDLPIH